MLLPLLLNNLLDTADTTAPVLSNATGTKTGSTTATGTVDTDEGNGTLYYYASTSSSETAATIKASGSSQAVSATGTQNVSFTSLTANTDYYAHYVHDDSSGNESNVKSSTPAFTTDEASEEASGGLWQWYDYEQARREQERKARAEAKRKAKEIKEFLDRELAIEERRIEDEAARKAELARLNRAVSKNQDFIKSFGSERLNFVMAEALEKQTFSKMERLERELGNLREEELFLMEATILLVNQ